MSKSMSTILLIKNMFEMKKTRVLKHYAEITI